MCLTKKLVDRFLEIFITSCNIIISPHQHHSSHHSLVPSTNSEQINPRRHANPGAPDQLMPASGKLGFVYMINKLPRNVIYVNFNIAGIGHAELYSHLSVERIGIAGEGERAGFGGFANIPCRVVEPYAPALAHRSAYGILEALYAERNYRARIPFGIGDEAKKRFCGRKPYLR